VTSPALVVWRAARAVRCPVCRAKPGEACRARGSKRIAAGSKRVAAGSRMADHHRARVLATGSDGTPRPASMPRPPASAGSNGKAPSWLLQDDSPTTGGALGLVAYDVSLRPDVHSDIRVTLRAEALQAIERDVQPVAHLTETGGVLVGLRELGKILITDASGHGPKSTRTPTAFAPDSLHDHAWTQGLHQWAGVVPVGAWHLHCSGGDLPSDVDLQAFAASAARLDGRWPPLAWLEVIVTPSRDPKHPSMSGWITSLASSADARSPWWACERVPIDAG
jgi:hypothetical protein